MTTATVDDFRWLISDAARQYLQNAATSDRSNLQQANQLRKVLTPIRTHLILEQVELRQRAKKKFSNAAQMFFTPKALEQSTSAAIAQYKATRFSNGRKVADLCCGIGGDLMALAKNNHATGVDRDEITAMLAAANAKLVSQATTVHAEDVTKIDHSQFDAVHIDPDRRADGRRTTRVEFHEPSEEFLTHLLINGPPLAMKLAPATNITPQWRSLVEAEWIGHQRECKQLVLWTAGLSEQINSRRVTILTNDGKVLCTHQTTEQTSCDVAEKIGRYLYEPHAAVLAANMEDTLAAKHSLMTIDRKVSYFTSDQLASEPAFAVFEVTEVLPYNLKKIRSLLKARAIGNLELKKRGLQLDLNEMAKKLKTAGKNQATLLFTKINHNKIAVLAQRIKTTTD